MGNKSDDSGVLRIDDNIENQIHSSILNKIVIAILCLTASGLWGQDTFADLPYRHGEEITYKVYYNLGPIWIGAGEVKFKVIEQPDHLQFTVTGKTFRAYDPIFKVRDYYKSKTSKETKLPYNFMRDIKEGKYERYDSISFDQYAFTVEEYFGHTREKAERFDFALDAAVHDMVSVIYHLRSQRSQSMSVGDKVPVRIFFDKELFELNVNYLGKENKRIKGQGKHVTHHFQPELIEGYVFKKDDLMDIWVTDDEAQVPLLIESPISLGSVKAVLTSYKKDSSSREVDNY